MLLKRKLRLSSSLWYRPASGSLSIISKRIGFRRVSRFYRCREGFHRSYRKGSEIAFSCSANQLKSLVKLVVDVEKKLNVQPKTRFWKSNIAGVVIIQPSKWWEPSLRIQFFTIMLRAGINRANHGREKLIDRLCTHRYFRETRDAVERFLDGFTFGKLESNYGTGWHSTFLYDDQLGRLKKSR